MTLLNYPWGGEHLLLRATPLLDGLAYPLHIWLSPTQVYNTLFLLSFVANGLTMYLLAAEVTGHSAAAFFAGGVYAFFPNRMGHALSGHLTYLAAWCFPLYVLFLLRFWRDPSWKHALLGGLCLGLSCLVALVQTAYFVLPLTALMIVGALFGGRGQLTAAHRRRGMALLALGALLALPSHLPLLRAAWNEGLELAAPGVIAHSVDLLALFLPSPYHPLWGMLVRRLPFMAALIPEANDLEHMAFLGWIVLGLAIVGALRRWRQTRLWLLLAGISLWLSLGPVLVVGQRVTGIPQPYALLARLPFYAWGRTPERLNQLTLFALALVAAQGMASLPPSRIVPGALVAGSLLEMLVLWPFPSGTPAPPSAFVASVREAPGVVLQLPIAKRQVSNLAMYYQSFHEQPIVGGYIHRELPGAREYAKALDALLTAQAADATRAATPDEIRGLLQGLAIRHLLLHRQFVRPEWFDGVAARLQAALGAPAADYGVGLAFVLPGKEERASASDDAPAAYFEDGLALLRVALPDAPVRPASWVTVTCVWGATQRPSADYTVAVHLLAAGGERVAQHDGPPLGGNWPTTLWAPGQVVHDQHGLRLPDDLQEGAYGLAIALYEYPSQRRLPVRAGRLPVRDDAVWMVGALRMTGD